MFPCRILSIIPPGGVVGAAPSVEILAGSADPSPAPTLTSRLEGGLEVVVATAVHTSSQERFWSDAQPRKLLPSRQRACDTVAAGLEKLDAPGILGLHFLDVEAPLAIEIAISGKPAKGSTHAPVRYARPHLEYASRTVSTSGLVPDAVTYPGARFHCRLRGRLGWTCSYGPSSCLGSHSVVVCAAAADLCRLAWLTCQSGATASPGRSTHSIMRTGELGPNCWIPRSYLDRAFMRLMRRL
jgi:hypothetical protein